MTAIELNHLAKMGPSLASRPMPSSPPLVLPEALLDEPTSQGLMVDREAVLG
jgi:hypothetical protein